MKTLLRLPLIITMVICSTMSSFASPNQHSRTIEKTFPVYLNTITIDHQYGNVTINEWDRNEINIKVEFIVKATYIDPVKVSQALNVEILPNMATEGTRIKTVIDQSILDKSGRNGLTFSINITILTPRLPKVDLLSKYSNATINADLKSLTSTMKYGNLTAKKLDKQSTINTKYGNVTIENASSIDANIKYGNLTINNASSINANIKYGNLTIDNASSINAIVEYGKIEIKRAKDAKFAAIAYSKLNIEEITNTLSVDELRYSSLNANATDSFTSININGSYSPIEISFDPNSTFHSDVSNSYAGNRFTVGFSGTSSSSATSTIRHSGICGKNHNDNGAQTNKRVVIKNRYSKIALLKK